MEKRQKVFVSAAIILILIGAFWIITHKITSTTGLTVSQTPDEIAKCLTESGAKMYGSKYCSHCAEQKALFGEAFQFISYVECTENPSACSGFEGVPAWIIKDKVYYGAQSLEKLKELAGC